MMTRTGPPLVDAMSTTRQKTTASPFRAMRAAAEDRASERKEKRDALLLAAVRMFNERGFHATLLEDVAASLNVTKPVIYNYLGNKDQVLFECVRLGLEELQAAANVARSQPGSGLDRLRAFLESYATIIMGEFGRCVIRTSDEALSEDARARFRSLKREIDDALRNAIAEAAADGSADVPDVQVAAFAFAGALNWPARWYDPAGPTPPAEMAAALVDTLISGIKPRGRRR
jgi:AcrR family transcriptional regulator